MRKYVTNEVAICSANIIHNNIKTIYVWAGSYVNVIKVRPFSNVKGKKVDNQNALLFPRHSPHIRNCLNTSCVRKVKGDFIAMTICEILDSFNKIVNFLKTRPTSIKDKKSQCYRFCFFHEICLRSRGCIWHAFVIIWSLDKDWIIFTFEIEFLFFW